MLKQIQEEITKLSLAKNLKDSPEVTERSGAWIVIGGKKLIDFTNWDSLGVSQEKYLLNQVQSFIEKNGITVSSARTRSGSTPALSASEIRLAKFLGAESSIIFSSKNQASLTLVSSIFGEQDLLCVEETSSSPIIDAAYLAHSQVITYRNSELANLSEALEKPIFTGKKAIFCEAGSPDFNLSSAINIARKYNALLFLDESFALGLVGPRGAGEHDRLSILQDVFCYFGSLSFGFGAYGGFIAGPKILTQYVLNRSKTLDSDPPIPPAVSNFIHLAIDHIETSIKPREIALSFSEKFQKTLMDAGFSFILFPGAPVSRLEISNKDEAVKLQLHLRSKGYHVELRSFFTKRKEKFFLQFIFSPKHSEKIIDNLIATLVECKKGIFSTSF